MNGASPGEWGGLAAATVIVLAAIGKGIIWLFDWGDRRRNSREAKLEKWQAELDAREKEHDAERERRRAEVEERLERMERTTSRALEQISALRLAFDLVSVALRGKDAADPSLRLADELLAVAFRLDPNIPTDMSGLLANIGAHTSPDAHNEDA